MAVPHRHASSRDAADAGLLASSQILFGTDFPYRTATETAQGIIDFGFSASDLALIARVNAARPMPRWQEE